MCKIMAYNIQENRFQRFADFSDIPEIFRSAKLNDIRQFYNGETLAKRMADIRESIVYIRENWTQYPSMIQSLQSDLENVKTSKNVQTLLTNIYNSKADWTDVNDRELFSVVRLYTSDEGYSKIFSSIDRIFRDHKSTENIPLIRSAVFLVELLNIDLFKYCSLNPQFANFSGTVYRGLALTREDLHSLETLMTKPISDRYIAIPLGLMTASTDEKIAEQFIGKLEDENIFPAIMKIHVINMKENNLKLYTDRYNSVVSTICAVDISELSGYPEEKEVLLRGPFFQLLGTTVVKCKSRNELHVFEMVMVNSNRDHISTMQLGESSGEAREVFGLLNSVTRCEFAIDFCSNAGLTGDEKLYRSMLTSDLQKLQTLL